MNAAALLQLPAGVVAVGKLADLLVLRRNPLDETTLRSLAHTDVAHVFVGGKQAL